MSEADDKDSKTEEPTGKRQDEALSKGQVPSSPEVANAVSLTITCIIVLGLSKNIMLDLRYGLVIFLERPEQISIDGGVLDRLFLDAGLLMLSVMTWPFILYIVGAVLGARAQHPFVFSTEAVGFNFSKLNPIGGLGKLFAASNFIEFGKSLLKLLILAPALIFILVDDIDRLPDTVAMDIDGMLFLLYDLMRKIFLAVLPIVIAIAVGDYFFKRHEHNENMKMTKQEVKDEYKQTEGNPEVKAKLRQIRIEKFRQRVAQAVPRADVVVTNPTHFAVALEYDQETMTAPRVTAKGADHLAARIRELAEANDVPIVANPPLARTLYASVDIDEEIRPDHYEAVAQVITYVMQLPGRIKDKKERLRQREAAREQSRHDEPAVRLDGDWPGRGNS